MCDEKRGYDPDEYMIGSGDLVSTACVLSEEDLKHVSHTSSDEVESDEVESVEEAPKNYDPDKRLLF